MKSRTTTNPSLTTSFSSLRRCKIFQIYLIIYFNYVTFSFSFFLPPHPMGGTHLFLHFFCPNRYRHLFLHSPLAVLSPLLQPPLSVIFPHQFLLCFVPILSVLCQLLFLTCFCTLSPPSPLRYSLQPHRPLDEAPFHLKEDKKGETSMILFENHCKIFNFRVFPIKLISLYDFTWCSILTPRMVTTPVVVGQSRTFENHIYHQGLGSGVEFVIFFTRARFPSF